MQLQLEALRPLCCTIVMVEIDGSFGEGGGQILRTSLSLSCLLGKPFRIYNIRKSRSRPGLMPAHITAVRAAASTSRAQVEGDSKGSLGIEFRPGRIRPGQYRFDIGTAGSTSLVLQTLLPPLIFSGDISNLVITGGTHVPFSPPFNYISEVFLPLLNRLGIEAAARIISYGFYPRGGGEISVTVRPCGKPSPLNSVDRGNLLRLSGISAVGNLPLSIAQRQRESLLGRLENMKAEIDTLEVNTPGQGTFVFLRAEYENSLCGFSALGERGKRAEKVGEEAADAFLGHHRSGASLDPHMADQIALYLSLAEGESVFTVSGITSHLRTNLHVISKFMGIISEVTPSGMVRIKGQRQF